MQAAIGQNRLIFPKRTKRPVSIVTNAVTEPAGSSAWVHTRLAEDVQGRSSTPGNTARAALPSAKSLWWDNVGRLPPANCSHPESHSRVARRETAHPIVSFDKTDQRTLGSFDSRMGRIDYNAFYRHNGGSAMGNASQAGSDFMVASCVSRERGGNLETCFRRRACGVLLLRRCLALRSIRSRLV